ncbi:MAG: TonB-dependent receptor [Micropepsaceae bacterium]
MLTSIRIGLAAIALAAGATGADAAGEEVTVTATRRSTALQETPIAITALGRRAIADAGIRDTQSITQLVPALQFPQSESSGSVTARIRGVGTQGSNPGLESAVGIFVDGVYRSRNAVGFGDLGELERIEVLRGPQGTLFGRNTSAGLISVVTRAPSLGEASAWASASYESFDGIGLTGGVSAPLQTDVAAVSLFASLRQREGYLRINPGIAGERDGNDRNSWTLRGQMMWEMGESASLRIIADGAHRDEECCYAVTLRAGAAARAGGLDVPDTIAAMLGHPGAGDRSTLKERIGYAEQDFGQTLDDWGVSAEFNAAIGGAKLTSITAWRDWDFTSGQDGDWTDIDIIHTENDGTNGYRFRTFTEELRLAGEAGPVDWLVGAYYLNETLDRRANTTFGADFETFLTRYRYNDSDTGIRDLLASALPGGYDAADPVWLSGSGNHDRYRQTSESIALFTHNIVSLSDTLKLTAGLRWTHETKDYRADYTTLASAGCAAIERDYGINPLANPAFTNATLRALTGFICLPQLRSALDGLDHVQSREENEFSGVGTLAWQAAPEINLYATYARGYKAGGFNLDRAFALGAFNPGSIVSGAPGSQTVAQPDTGFLPETVDAIELGAKLRLLDGDLTANVALFHERFENFQLNTYTGTSFLVTSVPEVVSEGAELDLAWRTPIEGLTADLGIAYVEARYGDDMAAFVALNPSLFLLPGAQLSNAPRWTVTGALTYEFAAFGDWTGLAHVDGRYVSDQIAGSNLDPAKTQGDYGLVNLKLGLERGGIGIELWARNVLDVHTFQIAFDGPYQGSAPNAANPNPSSFSQIGAFPNEPRTMGVTLKTRF